jgi:uncharacterized YigZ family protein
MPVFSYRTIVSAAQGIYKEKGSKFLAFAYPVSNEEQIKENLAVLRKQYFDARHQCYAWVLGAEKNKSRANDDGEPNHSAGDPILGQIRSKDLTNILIVVVRYFGGVKLGVGGLISAYKAAAEDALNQSQIIEEEVKKSFSLQYPYASTPEVMRLVKDFDVKVRGQKFADDCELSLQGSFRLYTALVEKIHLLDVTGVRVKLIES